MLSILKAAKNDVRIIGADDLYTLNTWVDAAYAVHPNMRSHTGRTMSFGIGTIHARSSKQKLNTKSSTEAEVVGLSEYLPYNLWFINFLTAQGFIVKRNVIHQDNQSAIKMERIGRNSCTGNSRHIHIRYFFIKDRVDKGEVNIVYCPTGDMLADFYTKPPQGNLFKRFRDVIMRYKPISILQDPNHLTHKLKERVEIPDNSNDKNVSLIADRHDIKLGNTKRERKVTFNLNSPPMTHIEQNTTDVETGYPPLHPDYANDKSFNKYAILATT